MKKLEKTAIREGIAIFPAFLMDAIKLFFFATDWWQANLITYDEESCRLVAGEKKIINSEKDLLAVVKLIGGHLYRIGGSVRDQVAKVPENDRDYVVCGVFNPRGTREAFYRLVSGVSFGGEFPVARFWMGGQKVEVSFTEKDIIGDLRGRDTTMNAMAIDVATGALVDPFGGQKDIKAGIVRHVSVDSFNPLAAFRAVRQLLQMEEKTGRKFRLAKETLLVMNQCRPDTAPIHRICFEAEDAMEMGRLSDFRFLLETAGIELGEFDAYEREFADVYVGPVPASPEEEPWESFPRFQPMYY